MTRRASLLLLLGVSGLVALLALLVLLMPRPADDAQGPDAVASPASPPPPGAASPATAILPDARPADDPGHAPEPLRTGTDETDVLGAVTARVIDRAGLPVAEAAVSVHRMRGQGIVRTRTALDASARSDADGRVRIARLPAGEPLGVQVRSPDFAPAVRETFVVEAGGTQDLGDVVLDPGFPLIGRVTDDQGAPIEAAEVELSELGFLEGGDPRPIVVPTDADGHYRVEHLARRQYSIEARAEDYAADGTVLSLMLGGAPTGQRQDFVLRLADSRLAGLVLGPDDGPVTACTVVASRRDARRRTYASLDTVTDADGRFRFEALADGTYRLELDSATHYLPRPLEVAAGRQDLVLRAQRGLQVRGLLVCDGEPPRRFGVRTRPDGRSGAGLLPGRDLLLSVIAADLPGHFVVPGLRPGSYRFEVSAEGWAVTTSQDVILGHDGGDAELLVQLIRGGTITGRVDPPASGLTAELRGADYDPSLATESLFPTQPVHGLVAPTAADGGFRIEHVPPGDYTLTVRGAARPPAHARDLRMEDGQELDVGVLQLPAGGTLFGNVFGPDGRPRAGLRVTATSDGHHAEAVTDVRGEFRLEAIPEGDYVVVAVPASLWEALRFEARTSVTVRAREEQPVLLELAERVQPPR